MCEVHRKPRRRVGPTLLAFAFLISSVSALLPTMTLAANPLNNSRLVEPADQTIARFSERWAKEWSAKNLDALMALYAEDAVFLTATGSRTTGRAAIRELFRQALAASSSDLRVQSKVTEQSGNLAYDSGEYEETTTAGGVTRSGRGNYLVILRRDRKKQWRIVEHMWTDVPTK